MTVQVISDKNSKVIVSVVAASAAEALQKATSQGITHLANVSLNSTDFTGRDLSYMQFEGGTFTSSTFTNCNLQGCDFSHCDLTGANFTGATVRYANFTGAKMTGAILVGTIGRPTGGSF